MSIIRRIQCCTYRPSPPNCLVLRSLNVLSSQFYVLSLRTPESDCHTVDGTLPEIVLVKWKPLNRYPLAQFDENVFTLLPTRTLIEQGNSFVLLLLERVSWKERHYCAHLGAGCNKTMGLLSKLC